MKNYLTTKQVFENRAAAIAAADGMKKTGWPEAKPVRISVQIADTQDLANVYVVEAAPGDFLLANGYVGR